MVGMGPIVVPSTTLVKPREVGEVKMGPAKNFAKRLYPVATLATRIDRRASDLARKIYDASTGTQWIACPPNVSMS